MAEGWAADALLTAVHSRPPKWFTGAAAREKAAGAPEACAGTVAWAQNQAQSTFDVWKEGVKDSQQGADGHRNGSTTATRLSKASPETYAGGQLKAYHVPGNGMSGMSSWLQ
ncbi:MULTISPECIES: putative T7SS-secreted protein [Streptomyces]|uniref:putative T7SS-secreted protein n=1 Tax=Streptomyces TaxID=1883 RepID=UPI0004C96A62|nr:MULTISPECIES: hypothetical protein [Streptomyces]RPK81284.1 hypothetical protein EES46_29605 [Streptomyces sp. ADI98-10]